MPPFAQSPFARLLRHIPAESGQRREALKDVVPKIETIIESWKDAMKEPAVEQIQTLCLNADLAFKCRVMGRNAKIHPENCAKTGVHPLNAHTFVPGYHESLLETQMGFQPAASALLRNKQKKFNEQIVDASSRLLRKIPFSNIEYLSLTGSNSFAALNIIEGQVRGIDPRLCDDNMMINREKVLELYPSWKKPISDGIPCIVFRWELEEACPNLPAFLSKAGYLSLIHISEPTRPY